MARDSQRGTMKRLLLFLAVAISAAAQVSYDRIRRGDSEPGNWLTYSGSYTSQRNSLLGHINDSNVRRLRPLWVYQVSAMDNLETSPLVVDGTMYLSEPGGNVTAIDTVSGRPLWK